MSSRQLQHVPHGMASRKTTFEIGTILDSVVDYVSKNYKLTDDVERKLARDLELSLILEDSLEDDVQIGTHRVKMKTSHLPNHDDDWLENHVDEDESNDEDTPRLLGDLCEDSEDEDTLPFGNQSGSGRWSSFSWSSLYDRTGTDSSLSWAEDVSDKRK